MRQHYLLQFLYPITADYFDGKWGGGLILFINTEHPEVPPPMEGELTYLFYSTPRTNREDKFIVPIQLEIKNSYQNTEKDVRLSLKYEKKHLRSVFTEKFIKSSSVGLSEDNPYELRSNSDYDYAIYGYKSIQAGESRSITDGAISENIKPKGLMQPSFSSRQGVNVTVFTRGERDKDRMWKLRFRGIEFNDTETVYKWIHDWLGKHIAFEVRDESTFWEYLWGYITNKEVVVYVFDPDFKYYERFKLYAPLSNPKEYKAGVFSPYVRELLFHEDN